MLLSRPENMKRASEAQQRTKNTESEETNVIEAEVFESEVKPLHGSFNTLSPSCPLMCLCESVYPPSRVCRCACWASLSLLHSGDKRQQRGTDQKTDLWRQVHEIRSATDTGVLSVNHCHNAAV